MEYQIHAKSQSGEFITLVGNTPLAAIRKCAAGTQAANARKIDGENTVHGLIVRDGSNAWFTPHAV